jgi:WD40 repeat protein
VITGGLEAVLEGYIYRMNTMVFSPDGSQVVSILSNWDAATIKLETILEGHSREVTSAIFSPDGR